VKPEELQAIRERIEGLRTLTLSMHIDAWKVVFTDAPKMLNEIERLRGALERILDELEDGYNNEAYRIARQALEGDQ
jgi:HAMP domain-containing protein